MQLNRSDRMKERLLAALALFLGVAAHKSFAQG
jgi:hypothetical protein